MSNDTSMLAARAHAQLENDTAVIKQEFPDIFADPERMREAHAWVGAILHHDYALGRMRPDLEVYREAGQRVIGQSRHTSERQRAPEPERIVDVELEARKAAIRKMQRWQGQLGVDEDDR